MHHVHWDEPSSRDEPPERLLVNVDSGPITARVAGGLPIDLEDAASITDISRLNCGSAIE